MHVVVGTELACEPRAARREVVTTRLLRFVSAPLIAFEPIDGSSWPEIWRAGTHPMRMRLFGIIPFGEQVIEISFPEPTRPDEFLLRDDGSGTVARRWDHRISIRPASRSGWTRYEDHVDVEAGVLTLPVWLFAQVLYRWRQRRWRRLARRDFRY